MALQILTVFQTKKVHFPHLFSDPRGGGGGGGGVGGWLVV